MIEQINNILELIIKSLSLLFSLFLSIGTIVIWMYLNKYDIGPEITELIGSPPLLLTIALTAISISIFMLVTFLFIPSTIRFCKNNPEFQWSNSTPNRSWIFYFLIPSIPLLAITIAGAANVDSIYYGVGLFFIATLLTYLFYKIHNGPIASNNENIVFTKTKCIVLLFFSFSFICLIMIYMMLVLSKITMSAFNDSTMQWIIFISMSVGCSLFISYASYNNDYQSFMPIAIISLLSTLVLFNGDIPDKIASKLGIGSYTKSFSVEAKYLDGIPNPKEYQIEKTKNPEILIINKPWILADLPNKLIIKSSKSSSRKYTIPRSAVLSEIE